MVLGERPLGLCSTCNSGSVCTRRKGIKLPVLFCEEFDAWTSRDTESRQVPLVDDEEPAVDTVMGLCGNCGNRDSCTLRDSPGGVWHCEEYR